MTIKLLDIESKQELADSNKFEDLKEPFDFTIEDKMSIFVSGFNGWKKSIPPIPLT